ncbi:B12-binding domain-containing radical SAM protein [Candidatus Hydrogenedentota bacterium]
MKVTLVYPEMGGDTDGLFSFAVASIAASLKHAGHETSLIHIYRPTSDEEIERRLREERPGLVGFSAMTQVFPYVKGLARLVKETIDVPTICGGIHPTIAPHRTLACGDIDYVCRGEGEDAIVELCDCLDKGGDPSVIRNIWTRRNGEVVENPMRPLREEDLDALPPMDRSIFDEGIEGNSEENLFFKATRGCPYQCTYCCEHLTQKLYRGLGKYVRFRPVDSVLDEIEAVLVDIPAKRILFGDETFGCNQKWFDEFCGKYKERIGLPFAINYRVNLTDEKVIRKLKDAGCCEIRFGLEHGNEQFRRDVLNRKMTNDEIINAFDLCRKYEIHSWSFNMVGLPFETEELAWDTVKLNARIKPTYSAIGVFFPFPKTVLYDACIENGFISIDAAEKLFDEEHKFDQPSKSILSLPEFPRDRIAYFYENWHDLLKKHRKHGKLWRLLHPHGKK